MNAEALALALLAAPLTWIALAIAEKIAPRNLFGAQMREQSPGTTPVRQLGGLVLVPIYLVTLALLASRYPEARPFLAALGAAIALLWFVGVADDHRHQPALLRLAAHFIAAAAVTITLPSSMTVLGGALPFWLERAVIAIALVYAINVTNFMDGMDLMSVVGLGIPLCACALLLAESATFEPVAVASLAMAAALIGFAWFNRPPARLYLGDNGALPLGLAGGTACIALALQSNAIAAILPFGYYLVDSASTLMLRMARGENLFHSHSGHAFQIARRAGRPVSWVAGRVLATNLALTAMAWFAASRGDAGSLTLAAASGAAISIVLVIHFRQQAKGALL